MKIKISIIILVVFILSIMLPFKYTYAISIEDIFKSADQNFLGAGSSKGTIDEGQLQKTSEFLFKLLLAIGIIVMVLVGTIIGIKFMVSNVEEKAKVKEILVPYIIGCAVILGAFTIWSIVVNIGQDLFPTPAGPVQTDPEQEEIIHVEGHGGKIDEEKEQEIMSDKPKVSEQDGKF